MAVTEADREPHPLENVLVLDKLLSYCDLNDLKTSRTVSHSWNNAICRALKKRAYCHIANLHQANIDDHLSFLESRFDNYWSCRYNLLIDLSGVVAATHALETASRIADLWDDDDCFESLTVIWPENFTLPEFILQRFEEFLKGLNLAQLTLHFKSLELSAGVTINSYASFIAGIVNVFSKIKKLAILLDRWTDEADPFMGIECKVIAEAFQQIGTWQWVEQLEFPMDMSDSFSTSLKEIQLEKLQHMKINIPAGIPGTNSRVIQHFAKNNCPSLKSVYIDFENPAFFIDFRLTDKDGRLLKALPKGVKLLSDCSNKLSMIASFLDFF